MVTTSDARQVQAYLDAHSNPPLDMTGHDGVIVVACNQCNAAQVFGAATDQERLDAFGAHTKTVARLLMLAEQADA